jgi:hypothetical protein
MPDIKPIPQSELEEFGFIPEPELEEFGFQSETAPSEPAISLEPKTTQLDAVLAGLREVPFGFGDEIGAAGATLFEAISPATETREGESELDRLGRVYNEYRDFTRKQTEQAKEEHPSTALTSQILGSLALPGAGFGAASKAVSAIPKAGKLLEKVIPTASMIGKGAVGGTLTELGHAEELDEEDLARKVGTGELSQALGKR